MRVPSMKETDIHLDKLPPQNLEAEQSILGAILIDNDALPRVLEIIDPDDFYKLSHRKLFSAMTDLFDKNEPIDLITLPDYLKMKNEMEAVGGLSYLSSLVAMTPTAANVKYHSHIVREKALLRGLLRSANDIAGKIYEENLDAEDLVDYAEKSIFDISDKRIKVSFVSLKEVIKDSFEMIEHLYDKKETITGVPSGFRDLDELHDRFSEGRSHSHRRAAFHGEDRVCAQCCTTCRSRDARTGSHIQPGNGKGTACLQNALCRGHGELEQHPKGLHQERGLAQTHQCGKQTYRRAYVYRRLIGGHSP